MDSEPWDVIFAGAGVSALLAARHILRQQPDARLLLLDERGGDPDDPRTMAYWVREEDPLPEQVARSWTQLNIDGPHGRLPLDLGGWRYAMVRGTDLRRAVLSEVERHAQCRVLEVNVDQIRDEADGAVVIAGEQRFSGRWVLDSRFDLDELEIPPGRHLLRQSFKGWWIETPDEAFDSDAPLLMDFRIPSEDVAFHYVLPETSRRALVMGVHMSPRRAREDLRTYVTDVLGIHDFTIEDFEGGVTPMTDAPFPRRVGDHVLRIGIAGGRLRPSTGYAFVRMDRDAAAIGTSLVRHGHPFDLHAEPWTLQVLDGILLVVLTRYPRRAAEIFSALFARNPSSRVLRLLDDRPTWTDMLAIAWNMPWWPFV